MTGYIIYYQQEEERGLRLSESAEAAATTASITGLIAGATYSITMVATSSTLPSTETAALTVSIGTLYTQNLHISTYSKHHLIHRYIQNLCIMAYSKQKTFDVACVLYMSHLSHFRYNTKM